MDISDELSESNELPDDESSDSESDYFKKVAESIAQQDEIDKKGNIHILAHK